MIYIYDCKTFKPEGKYKKCSHPHALAIPDCSILFLEIKTGLKSLKTCSQEEF